jgi:ankyrin repeat protein
MGNIQDTLFTAIHDNNLAQVQSLSIDRTSVPEHVLVDAWLEAVAYDRLSILEYLASHSIGDIVATATDVNMRTSLHYAISADVVRFLIQNGAIVTARDDMRRTPLHTAIENKRSDVAIALIDVMLDFEMLDSAGDRALTLAARVGLVDIVRRLIMAGANHTATAPFGTSDLSSSSTDASTATATSTATSTSTSSTASPQDSPRTCVKYQLGAAHLAASAGHLDVVRYFVEDLNMDIEMRSDFGVTLLHVAGMLRCHS